MVLEFRRIRFVKFNDLNRSSGIRKFTTNNIQLLYTKRSVGIPIESNLIKCIQAQYLNPNICSLIYNGSASFIPVYVDV